MASGGLTFVGLAPHPPLLVPEVGGPEIDQVRGSTAAMQTLAARVLASGAESLVVISPHAPLERDAFVAYADPEVRGDFSRFRAPRARVALPVDHELLGALTEAGAAARLPVTPIRGCALDHGTAVPLLLLQRNGWTGPVVALGYSFLSNDDHLRLGRCLAAAASSAGRRVAVVASGDLSHRLAPGAPAGFDPDAHRFDEQVVSAVRESRLDRIVCLSPTLRECAGECGYNSMLVACGAAEALPVRGEVLHYEAPFGVGYLTAQLA